VKRIVGRFVFPIAACMSVAIAVGHTQSLLTHHVRQAMQDGSARSIGRLPASQAMNLVIALPLRNEDQLDQLLKDLYDPASPGYRQFLTVEQFTEMFSPTQQEYAAALDFAKENGFTVTGTSSNRLIVQVSGSVANVEAAFHVNIGVYQHPTENRTFYAPDREPTTNLTFSLWHVSGLDNYSIPHPAGLDKRSDGAGSSSNATTGSGPSASFLGSDMRAAYYGGTALTGAGQSVGLLEFHGTDLADLTTYFTNAKQTNNVPITLLSTDGTSTSCLDSMAGGNCDDTEQTLDITQALGMAPGLSSLVVYVGSSDAAIFNAMATANPLNAQLGSSWTWTPSDPTTDDPYFKEFAAQGQNLFQAAGDNKKWTTTGKASEIYPADDVYVTSVGGTDLATSSAAGPWASETAWANSGGGISPDELAIPSWQTAAAAGCASCSQTYRNGPDVSANANYTFYVCADQTTCTANNWGGTSFAAPMWAGYMALINQQSVANGKKTLGFINPSLYSIGAGSSYTTDFHDITSGSNGYPAATGYDLATGWGSPNGSGLINALAGSSSAATITSPTPGSTLTSASTTFTWNAGPAGTTGYGLNVGTTGVGSANLVNIGPLSGTSVTVNLPTNGTTIYVRLWTELSGPTYLYNDYTYTEFTQSASAIISPVPSGTLTSAATTFTWNAGPAGTTGYGLNVGTTGVGSANLVNIGPLSGTSVTVNLPTNGTKIYVRLWTDPQRHDLPLQRLHLHRVHAICIRNHQPNAGRHVDLGSDHLYLERRPCWNDGLRPQRWHNGRWVCQSGQYLSSVRHQHDRESAHQRNHHLRAALDSAQRHDLPLQRLHLHRVLAICIRDHQPNAGRHVDLGFNHLHLERRPCWNDGLRPQRWHNGRWVCQSGQYLSSVRHQHDRESAHQRNHHLRAALDSAQRHDLPLQRLHLHRVLAICIRNHQPDSRQHVDLGFNHLHLEPRPCWNDGLRPQRWHIARRRRSGQHRSSVRHQRDGESAQQRNHDLCAALDRAQRPDLPLQRLHLH
jgi:hypothetical protein